MNQKMLIVAVGALVFSSAACAPGAERVRTTEARMVGTQALELRRCLGPPESFEIRAQDEIAIFRSVLTRDQLLVPTFPNGRVFRPTVSVRSTCL